MNHYYPEGWKLDTPGKSGCHADRPPPCRPHGEKDAFWKRAPCCVTGGHNLIIDLGCMKGLIPREEGAVGIREGTARDIAILSRVNRPVCFLVQGFFKDENGATTALLSRRAAQEECRRGLSKPPDARGCDPGARHASGARSARLRMWAAAWWRCCRSTPSPFRASITRGSGSPPAWISAQWYAPWKGRASRSRTRSCSARGRKMPPSSTPGKRWAASCAAWSHYGRVCGAGAEPGRSGGEP